MIQKTRNLTALFIGRFQPFHLGHLSVISDLEKNKDIGKIIVAIGSAQYKDSYKNPYGLLERKKMIKSAIKGKIKKRLLIKAIPDTNDNGAWVNHVMKITGDINVAYTGNPLVRRLFKDKKILVRPVKKIIKISGTKLRKMIKNNDKAWTEYVSKEAIRIIKAKL